MQKIFASIADLPASVRARLSEAEQRQWREVFNSVFENTQGNQAAKESAAFRFANGVIARGRRSSHKRRGDFEKHVRIEKIDDEQRMVWGWAYLCVDEQGAQVVDHSGDVIEMAEIHKAAHDFMQESRIGGEMHVSEAGVVPESIVVTDAVADELRMTTMKRGWFIGYHVDDDDAWDGVKSGRYQAFSIGGTADVEDLSGPAS